MSNEGHFTRDSSDNEAGRVVNEEVKNLKYVTLTFTSTTPQTIPNLEGYTKVSFLAVVTGATDASTLRGKLDKSSDQSGLLTGNIGWRDTGNSDHNSTNVTSFPLVVVNNAAERNSIECSAMEITITPITTDTVTVHFTFRP